MFFNVFNVLIIVIKFTYCTIIVKRIIIYNYIIKHERRNNEEVISMFEDPDIIATMKNKRISWTEHVWWVRKQTIYQVINWKPKSKRPLSRQRQGWINRIHIDLDMLGILDGEELATDRDRWSKAVRSNKKKKKKHHAHTHQNVSAS